MFDTINLITSIFKTERAKEFKDDLIDGFIDWIEPLFLKNEPDLVKDLKTKQNDEETQRKLKATVAEISKIKETRDMLQEKLAEINKFVSTQNIIVQDNIENQINIQKHTGNLVEHQYNTPQEQEADKDVFLFDIKMLVASGDLKKGVEIFLELTKVNYPNKINEAILLAGRFNSTKQKEMLGTTTPQDAAVEYTKISKALLFYVDKCH